MKNNFSLLHTTLALIGLLAFAVQSSPAAPLVIGAEGWTADTPAGVTYGGLSGGIAPGDGSSPTNNAGVGSYTFQITLASAVYVSTTIHFISSSNAIDESYFRLSFIGTNTGAIAWTGMNIVITDVTTDPIPVEGDTTSHPVRAHLHRNLWTDGAFTKADAYTGSNGRYDMALALGAPLTTGNSASGATLRLHDGNETGTDPMRFDLTFTPVPEPSAFILVGSGLMGLIGYGLATAKKTKGNDPAAGRS